MAHNLQVEQQKEEIYEGMYEWKVDCALGSMFNDRSPVFKFGRYHSFLQLRFPIFSIAGRMSTHLEIELQIVELLEKYTLSKLLSVCLVFNNGCYFNMILNMGPFIKCNSFTVMTLNAGLENFTKIGTERILTFRLAWSDDSYRLNSLMHLKTTKGQIKGKISTKNLQKLFNDLGDLYESKTNTDCVLKVGGEEFPVHRGLLCARSSVFAAMFLHNTSERQSGVVEISDASAEILNDVLLYIYTGHIQGLTPESAASMYAVADKYELLEMRDDCLKFLRHNITMENIVDAIQLANLLEESELEEKVIIFIKDNSEELQKTEKWKVFSQTNTLLALKYIHSALNAFSRPKAKRPRNEMTNRI